MQGRGKRQIREMSFCGNRRKLTSSRQYVVKGKYANDTCHDCHRENPVAQRVATRRTCHRKNDSNTHKGDPAHHSLGTYPWGQHQYWSEKPETAFRQTPREESAHRQPKTDIALCQCRKSRLSKQRQHPARQNGVQSMRTPPAECMCPAHQKNQIKQTVENKTCRQKRGSRPSERIRDGENKRQ